MLIIEINGENKDACNYEDAYYTIESNVDTFLKKHKSEMYDKWLSLGFNRIHTYINTHSETSKELFGSMTPQSQERLIWSRDDKNGAVKLCPYDIQDSRLRKLCFKLCLKWLLRCIKKMNIPISIFVSYEEYRPRKRKKLNNNH